MESTGKYYIPVYNVLENTSNSILLVLNILRLSDDIFKHDLVAGSFMPPADIRQLHDLIRYRFKLICFNSSKKNRLQNFLTVSNIQLRNVVSGSFGKSDQMIQDKLLENPADTSFDLELLFFII